jgi:hypothetical protein
MKTTFFMAAPLAITARCCSALSVVQRGRICATSRSLRLLRQTRFPCSATKCSQTGPLTAPSSGASKGCSKTYDQINGTHCACNVDTELRAEQTAERWCYPPQVPR